MSEVTAPTRAVLVVDDDPLVLRAHGRVLERAGFDVETAADGDGAITALARRAFDVIVSDIDMPGMNGLALLEQVRRRDLDVPVILVTGAPTLDAATKAVEHGALRFLVKPIDIDAFVKTVGDAVRLHAIARAKRQALDLAGGVDRLVGDHAGLIAAFERAVESMWVAYQPIVSWSTSRVYAYEALIRPREAALPHPGALIAAAERLDRLDLLGRAIRARAIAPLAEMTEGALLFVNLHPRDLFDDELVAPEGAFAAVAPRVVLEVTERAALQDMVAVRSRVQRLRELGFRIALDDLGAGYAGLSSFALLEPEVVKLDLALVRDLHLSPTKQKLVGTMITMCRELGIVITAEGIETAEERDALTALGCDLLQGYLFARPGPAFPVPTY